MEKFIHALYISSARKIWQVAYLFKTVGTTSEQQARNRQDIEKIINECLEQVIRSFLPWQSIAKQFSMPSTEVPSIVSEAEPKRHVVFDEESEEEDERPPLTVGDDDASIDFESLDIAEEKKEEEEVDPLKEIEGNAKTEFVLNL
jgi:DNA-directed RNA polymerase specialized sigma subunit